jgi:hypothetical protein
MARRLCRPEERLVAETFRIMPASIVAANSIDFGNDDC